MGVKGKIFKSGDKASQHYLPGGYSLLDYIKGTGGFVSINNGVIMGDCQAGEPNKILWFGGATEAEEVLRDGKLLDAVKHAFSPGGGYVPQKIGAWRVNPGVQSGHEYKKGADVMIETKSKDYGLHTNQIKTKLEDGTGAVGKKITLQFANNDAEVWDLVKKDSFQIQYTGSGDPATMSITKTQLTTSITGNGEDLTINFSEYATIEDLVSYINDQASYTCTIKTPIPTDPTTELDGVSGQDILGAAYTATSDLQALIDALNKSIWTESNYKVAATSRDVPDNETSWVYFTGGAAGSYSPTEWGISLGLAEAEDIQFVSTPSEDASVHLLIRTHCEKMNSVTGKNERQFIVGGAAGETVAQAVTRAQNLNSDAGMLKFPGFKHYDFDDLSGETTKTWSPAYYAAKALGLTTVLSIQEPLTNKSVDVLEWEKKLTIPEAEELIQAGVSCGISSRTGRLTNARSVTTYQGDMLQRNEFSMMRISLFVSKDLRTAVEENFTGKAMADTQLAKVDAIAQGKLSEYADMGLFNGNPPYWGYRKTITGDVIKIDYDANVTTPINFLFIASHLHVYASVSA